MGFILKTIYQSNYAKFIEAIVLARKKQDLTQAQVATALGKPQSYIAKIEAKDRKLDIVEFVALCEAINQAPCELIKFLQSDVSDFTTTNDTSCRSS